MRFPVRHLFLLSLLLAPGLAACGAGGVDAPDAPTAPVPAVLHQAGYLPGTGRYVVGGATPALPQIPVRIVGEDVDPSRWAMLHDGTHYRLAFMARDLPARVIVFGYDPSVNRYERAFPAPTVLPLEGLPQDTDLSSFAMLRGDGIWRLYTRSRSDPTTLYQFGRAGDVFRLGYRSIPAMRLAGLPTDADPTRWAMHHANGVYRVLVGKDGDASTYYQLGFDGARGSYVFGHDSRRTIHVEGMPGDADRRSFASVYADGYYRFYHLGR